MLYHQISKKISRPYLVFKDFYKFKDLQESVATGQAKLELQKWINNGRINQ